MRINKIISIGKMFWSFIKSPRVIIYGLPRAQTSLSLSLSLSLDENLRVKEWVGGERRKRARRRFASRLFPSHTPLRFAFASARKTENEAPEKEEEETGLKKYMEMGLENLYVDSAA